MRYSYISKVERLFPKTKKSEPLKFFNRKVISTENKQLRTQKSPKIFQFSGFALTHFKSAH